MRIFRENPAQRFPGPARYKCNHAKLRTRWSFGVILCLVIVSIPGCAPRKRSYVPPQDPATLTDTAFLHYLATVPVVTVDEGTRATLLLVGGTQVWTTFDARSAELARRGAFQPSWGLSPDDTLDKGTLAYMFARTCQAPGSVNTILAAKTGIGDRRAALQVCVYEGLLTQGHPHDPVAGGELVGALEAAERFMGNRALNPNTAVK